MKIKSLKVKFVGKICQFIEQTFQNQKRENKFYISQKYCIRICFYSVSLIDLTHSPAVKPFHYYYIDCFPSWKTCGATFLISRKGGRKVEPVV
jgi:hypothetical protein